MAAAVVLRPPAAELPARPRPRPQVCRRPADGVDGGARESRALAGCLPLNPSLGSPATAAAYPTRPLTPRSLQRRFVDAGSQSECLTSGSPETWRRGAPPPAAVRQRSAGPCASSAVSLQEHLQETTEACADALSRRRSVTQGGRSFNTWSFRRQRPGSATQRS
eukprot:TRINITY_DN57811_c0_g1_i1.p2 TRINITY_DN57811_c0_g1~~TRINITY_DN57811_c0_g1_i1.p2  ORF type:complete len:191 (-),score=7.13 TRINITY_DN57811_c0_g1_i1:83-574(-)